MEFFGVIIWGAIIYGIYRAFKKRPKNKSSQPIQPIIVQPEPLPYKKKDYLLSVAEKSFYRILSQITDKHNVLLFAKVRLEDLLWIPWGTDNRFGLRNRIKSRHIDFVICDKENVRPLLVIELDDNSHKREDRIERDYNVDRILNDAGLPILHQRVQYSYNPQELEDKISSLLK